MQTPQIKVCGITDVSEIEYLYEQQVEYAGFVLFYEKSKRNNSVEKVFSLLRALHMPGHSYTMKSIAVTVEPTAEQIRIIEKLGFDYIQVHGKLQKECFDVIHIPIIRAIPAGNMELFERCNNCIKVEALLFDASSPGSGCIFDWSKLPDRNAIFKRLFLAGGLCTDNILEAIKNVQPDVVDVSSGVEFDMETVGKDPIKIGEFVRKVRTHE